MVPWRAVLPWTDCSFKWCFWIAGGLGKLNFIFSPSRMVWWGKFAWEGFRPASRRVPGSFFSFMNSFTRRNEWSQMVKAESAIAYLDLPGLRCLVGGMMCIITNFEVLLGLLTNTYRGALAAKSLDGGQSLTIVGIALYCRIFENYWMPLS